MIKSLIENATWIDWFIKSMLIIIPIVPLHIPYSINKLLRYIIYASGYNLIKEGRLVLILIIYSEEEESYYIEYIILID